MKKNGAIYIPTLMREVSTYVYGENPSFLSDPFLTRDGNHAEMAKARESAFQETMRNDKSGQWYKEHLPLAMRNLKRAFDAGIPVAMGTDTGPAYRFQGYFEHLELEQMVKSGLTPMQAIVSATSTASRAMNAADQIGTLEYRKWADFLVLDANPLDDIANTRKLASVWIAGNQVPRWQARLLQRLRPGDPRVPRAHHRRHHLPRRVRLQAVHRHEPRPPRAGWQALLGRRHPQVPAGAT
jgi:hypothetical protein